MVKAAIKIPSSWSGCSDRQAAIIISILTLSSGISEEEALLICSLRLTGISLISADEEGALLLIPKVWCEPRRSIMSKIPYERLRLLISEMRWALDMPHIPWRPQKLCKATPLPADLSDLTFGQFIHTDALYQGYVASGNPEMIGRIASALIPKARRAPVAWECRALVMWWASAKTALALRFPDLFRPSSSESGALAPSPQQNFQASFDAQMRALTKGDPLKEDAVLRLPLYRALTELNAQAAEYAALKSAIKK